MDLNVGTSSPIGRIVRINGFDPRIGEEHEHGAFVPDPLPAVVSLSPEVATAASRAAAAVARLDQASSSLPNPMLLVRPTLRREAVGTSALEGTYAALEDVLEADLLDGPASSPQVREVHNYVEIAEMAYHWVTERPITVGMLAELQKLLVRGTPSQSREAGRVRTIQVFIGAGSGRVADARFVPPPPGDHLRDGLEAWERWINTDNDRLPMSVQIALAHYQFETLHPFQDGNGRLGRLVCLLQLLRGRELAYPVLDLSPWLERHQRQYQDHLLECSRTGEFDGWIRFFCEALRGQASRAVHRINDLVSWRAELLADLAAERVRGAIVDVAADLIGYPAVTAHSVAQRHGVSYPTANAAIRRLERMGVLSELTGRQRGRMYMADGVVTLLSLAGTPPLNRV